MCKKSIYNNKEFLEKLIKEEHWGKKKSLRAIAKEFSVSSYSISSWCKRYGIKVRTNAETLSMQKNTFLKEKQLTKEFLEKLIKEEHIKNGVNIKTIAKRFKICTTSFRSRLDFYNITYFRIGKRSAHTAENIFEKLINFFKSTNVKCKHKTIVEGHFINFLINDKIIFEANQRGIKEFINPSPNNQRGIRALKRDKLLCSRGYTIVRVHQDVLCGKPNDFRKFGKLIEVLKNYIPNLNISRINPPPIMSKYRVVARQAYTGTIITY